MGLSWSNYKKSTRLVWGIRRQIFSFLLSFHMFPTNLYELCFFPNNFHIFHNCAWLFRFIINLPKPSLFHFVCLILLFLFTKIFKNFYIFVSFKKWRARHFHEHMRMWYVIFVSRVVYYLVVVRKLIIHMINMWRLTNWVFNLTKL